MHNGGFEMVRRWYDIFVPMTPTRRHDDKANSSRRLTFVIEENKAVLS